MSVFFKIISFVPQHKKINTSVMKKFLHISLSLLIIFFISSCSDDDKSDSEKERNLKISYTLDKNDAHFVFTNNNQENVEVQFFLRYKTGVTDFTFRDQLDQFKLSHGQTIQKTYSLEGTMPNSIGYKCLVK